MTKKTGTFRIISDVNGNAQKRQISVRTAGLDGELTKMMTDMTRTTIVEALCHRRPIMCQGSRRLEESWSREKPDVHFHREGRNEAPSVSGWNRKNVLAEGPY